MLINTRVPLFNKVRYYNNIYISRRYKVLRTLYKDTKDVLTK